MIQSAHKPAHGIIASIIGIIALLAGASGVFGEIQDALNIMWDVDTEAKSGVWNLVKSRLLSYGMVLVIGFLLLVSLVVSAFVAATFKFLGGVIPVPEVVLHGAELIVSLFVITLLFALLFKVLPDIKVTWNDVLFGAFTTAVLFTIGKFAIGIYLGKSVSSSAYGAAGSLVLVISWIYYSALILYFGAEFTHVYATEFGSLIGQPRKAPGDRAKRSAVRIPSKTPEQHIPQLVEAAKAENHPARGLAVLTTIPAVIRSELQLAKAETKLELNKIAVAAGLIAAGLVLAAYALGFALLTILYALKIPMVPWIAAIILILLTTSLVLALVSVGRKRLKQVHVPPQRAASSVSQDVQLLKHRFSRSPAKS